MSPKYENLPRVFVFYKEGGARHGTIAAVVSGPVPKAGDQVVVASRHRDPDAPCAFIPWVIVPGVATSCACSGAMVRATGMSSTAPSVLVT